MSTGFAFPKSAVSATARRSGGEGPVDVVVSHQSSARDGHRLVVNETKGAVPTLGYGEDIVCGTTEEEHVP